MHRLPMHLAPIIHMPHHIRLPIPPYYKHSAAIRINHSLVDITRRLRFLGVESAEDAADDHACYHDESEEGEETVPKLGVG